MEFNQGELRRILKYEKDTGLFWWRVNKSNRVNINKPAGSMNNKGYIVIKINNKRYYAHRLAFLYINGAEPKSIIDHINMIKDDNRWCNLREASLSQNQHNTGLPSTNTSGLKGVIWNKRDRKWVAQIRCNGVRKSLGTYNSKIEAHNAYRKAAKELHGEFFNL